MAVKVVLQRRLEPWRWGAQWLPIRSWQWPTERIIEVDPLTTQEVAQELNVNHSMVIWHLKQIGRVKKLDKQVPHQLTAHQKKKKNYHFEMSSSLILCNNSELYLQWIVMCDEKWILCDNQQWPALWLNWEEAPKHFPKPYFESWSLFGSLLLLWSTTVFWISVKPLHLRSMLNKSMRCTENSNACSCHWSTERAQFFSSTMPNHMSHNQHFKSWMKWAKNFAFVAQLYLLYLPDLLPTDYLPLPQAP